MSGHIEQAIMRAIEAMRDNLGEPLTLDDIARAARFSKYHFSRIFVNATGVAPGRFLSALRLEKAKELLLTTDWHVVDIGTAVGYHSVGTFSTRFSRSVGLSPTNYRRFRGFAPRHPAAVSLHSSRRTTIQGTVSVPPGAEWTTLYIGVFPGPIPEGTPLAGTLLSRPGPYELVVSGFDVDAAHLSAFSVPSAGMDGGHAMEHAGNWLTGGRPLDGLVPGTTVSVADLPLRPRSEFDLPVLVAAPADSPASDWTPHQRGKYPCAR
ncbi:AraC family transcriptional regulator [Streptomyces klenkii]|uniref:AraC family transcriptional regulator n=1 Tax=Streptomyces klenkii TaxID=1420899 RepID=UPI003430D455